MTVKVLIVDDSSFFRKRLTDIIGQDPRLEVVATANNGQEALEKLQSCQPDVITMDLEMPVMDGITAVRKIMAIKKTPVLMLSTWTTDGAKPTLDALEAGATDFFPKRFEDLSRDQQIVQRKLCHRIYQIAQGFHAAPAVAIPVTRPTTPSRQPQQDRLELVAIGTSTGGPVALQKVLMQLPASFPHPILLIQHMPGTFTPSFAERLNTLCKIQVKQAVNGENIKAGTAYLAPGGQQMLLRGRGENRYVVVQDGAAEQTYKPCVDLTLESISAICGQQTLAIILTGMGSDGKIGCEKIKAAGGQVWAQDQQSSTIYGMPMAVAKAGLADKVLDLMEIGKQLGQIE